MALVFNSYTLIVGSHTNKDVLITKRSGGTVH